MAQTVARLSAATPGALASSFMRASAFVLPILITVGNSSIALGGVYTDDLSKCLVKSSNADDRVMLVRWIFTELALHPAVKPLTSVTDEQRDDANKKMVATFVRLLTSDCRKEAVDALKYEGAAAMGTSFQVLGQMASRDLMTESHVASGMNELGKYLEGEDKLNALLRDSGLSK